MEKATKSKVDMDTIVSLCKRRGFVFQSSDIYGGLGSCWDYGPLGVELKNNIKRAWWKAMVQERDDMVGLDASILMHPQVWVASGHVAGFADPMVDCRECQHRFRADRLWVAQAGEDADAKYVSVYEDGPEEAKAELVKKAGKAPMGDPALLSDHSSYPLIGKTPCPSCGKSGVLTDPRMFNLMFRTSAGPVNPLDDLLFSLDALIAQGSPVDPEDMQSFRDFAKEQVERAQVYLRPETAQGIFVNFSNVLNTTRRKLPFGIAQVGKAFRNEITPGNFTFRSREFEQMEIEFFVTPGTDEEWLKRWLDIRYQWYLSLGIKEENVRLRQHMHTELAHYAKDCYDVEYLFPMGWAELEGIANRADFDLSQHSKFSGKDLNYFDEETGQHVVPFVIEPSGGTDRATLAFIIDAYDEEPDKDGTRVVLRFHPSLAPVKVAILPLSKKEPLTALAREVHAMVRKHWMTQYDEVQSIGRRYRRQDEIGTPLCVTIDFQSLDDRQVTVRDRDTMSQVRIPIDDLIALLAGRLG
ncbi:MAG: glycine--tRNA ligase [Dehalococcoidia bacterium]|nr:glycine--tRNA ligase [Dehalococcoidia bacterium]